MTDIASDIINCIGLIAALAVLTWAVWKESKQ